MTETGSGVSPEAAAAELLGTTPETPATTPEVPSPTMAEVAAQVDAELATETGDEPQVEKEPAKTPETKATEAKITRLQALIDSKYGGDEDKFVDGLHESWKSMSVLHKELKELKASLQPPKETDPPPADHPDLKWFDTQVSSLDEELKTNETKQGRLAERANAIQARINELKGEVNRADDLDKPGLKDKIESQIERLEDLSEKWQEYATRNKRIESEKREYDRRKTSAIRDLEAARDQLEKAQQDLVAYQASERQKFNAALTAAADEMGLAPDSDERGYFEDTLRAETSYVLRADPEGDPIDLAAFVKTRAAVFAKIHNKGKAQDFKKLSEAKLAAATKPAVITPPKPGATPPAAVTPAAKENKKWSADFARIRASKILGG